ncbi:hypothetical protein [Nonomuraea cavernae]|nr:hypothetical protein [Nonomuraea cavernae]
MSGVPPKRTTAVAVDRRVRVAGSTKYSSTVRTHSSPWESAGFPWE